MSAPCAGRGKPEVEAVLRLNPSYRRLCRIVEHEQQGKSRADYGTRLLSLLADELTAAYGKGFSARNLRNFRQFYILFPNEEIWYTRVPNLTWSHIRSLLRVTNEDARMRYLNEAARQTWSVRTLDRNISPNFPITKIV